MTVQNYIKVLPESLSNKIAAGEVVERPASVVKELVENSLDAGGTEIMVIIKEGGKTLIQVVDNGQGMSRDDALLAFQRHTTSKIAVDEDLENIRTFGFRGEALSSIASVARVEIKTTRADNSPGTLIKLEGGVLTDIRDAAAPPGTSIAVKNIFFNTPARRKFLRSVAAEYRQILEVFKRFALAFPEVSFSLVNEGEIVYELHPSPLEQRIVAVLGDRCTGHLIAVNDDETFVKISGFVGDWDLFRKSRGQQFLFLNQRYIVDRSLNHAIISAYGTALPESSFPLYLIFLEMDPEHVDVNVHPTKMEVKFAEDRALYSITRNAVGRALTSDAIIPQAHAAFRSDVPAFSPSNFEQSELDWQLPSTPPAEPTALTGKPPGQPPGDATDYIRREWRARGITPSESSTPPAAPTTPATTSPESQTRDRRPFVWQVHNRYILTQTKKGLIVIDQHVAHERILFERAMANFENKSPVSQQLLFPEVIELSPEEHSYFMEILPFLNYIGYEIKQFSARTISIDAVPSGVKNAAAPRVLLEILDEYRKSKADNYDIREKLAASFACKTAIKAGEKLTSEEMIALIDQLFQTRTPYFCPHGRPIIITISLEELDRRFGRT